MLHADVTTIGRVQTLVRQARARGLLWLAARVCQELKTPGKLPGRLYRAAVVSLYLALFRSVGAIAKLFMPTDDCVTVFYDLNVSPVTFDVLWALAAAEMIRRETGATSIHFVLIRGGSDGFRVEQPEYETSVPTESRRKRLENIVLKMPRLARLNAKITVCDSRLYGTLLRATRKGGVYPADYWPAFPSAHKPKDVMARVRAGESAPFMLHAQPEGLQAFETWLGDRAQGRRLIMITLRSYSHYLVRNSNVDAWRAFAERLDETVYFPVFIPDTAMGQDEAAALLAGFAICVPAAQDIGVRMAAYESAYLNMMVNNGPHGLCMFSEKCRYLMFKILTPDAPQTTMEYMELLGFEIDEDPPFAKSYQKWIWDEDRLEIIEQAFEEMRQTIDREDRSY